MIVSISNKRSSGFGINSITNSASIAAVLAMVLPPLLLIFTVVGSGVAAAQDKLQISVIFLTRDEEAPLPLSLLDRRVEDNGRPGARLGIDDNNTTGRFTNQEYAYEEVAVPEGEDIVKAFSELVAAGNQLFLLDLTAPDIKALSESDAAAATLLFNIRATDDSLRNEHCAPMLLHIAPSRSMLTDGLVQYLAWKRWSTTALIVGPHTEDQAYAEALRRSTKRFGVKIVDEIAWTFEPGARRTDSGHHTAQQEIPSATQLDDYQVLLVADERDEFGEYLPYRTFEPRPVAGTQGLTPTSWHRSHEQWGATQIQRRFEKLAERGMTPRDYAAWAATRVIGEAVTKTASADTATLREYILGEEFRLAAFKGVPLTFRDWNGQLRQPVLVVGPRMLVTVSPQQEFLHERSPLDTLGWDQPESACQAFAG